MTRGLELAPKRLRVNAICPGRCGRGRGGGRPSSAATITGQAINVDGGITLGPRVA